MLIFDNITRANSNSDLSSKTTLTNGIYSINRKRDDNYRYFYVKVNNDMLGVTNNDVENIYHLEFLIKTLQRMSLVTQKIQMSLFSIDQQNQLYHLL